MKLGGEFKCPYCNHIQERDIECHAIITCDSCSKPYHGYVKITTTVLPLGGLEHGCYREGRECQGKSAVSQA